MITVKNLTKRFGRATVVDQVSFSVRAGESVALWGPNGAGKTTIIRCLLGLLPFEGRIEIDGHDLCSAGKGARRSVGYVPQELAFYDDFRLYEATRFFARLKKSSQARAASVLSEVGLVEHERKRIRELSGGMKQRLALALALLADPPVLLLDELTSNLDSAARADFTHSLQRLQQQGKTLIFTTHRQEEVDALAERVLVLNEGKLQADRHAKGSPPTNRVGALLKIEVSPQALDDALVALRSDGFTAQRNGTSVLIEVAPELRMGPIETLTRAAIGIHTFDLRAPDATGVDGEESLS